MQQPIGKALCDTPWNVYFDSNFQADDTNRTAGVELSLSKDFSWIDRHWVIPAIYQCEEGLVLDIAMELDEATLQSSAEHLYDSCEPEPDMIASCSDSKPSAAEILRISERYDLESPKSHSTDVSIPVQEKIQYEKEYDPYPLDITPQLIVNGQDMQEYWGSSICWDPSGHTQTDPARFVLEHYDLDGFQRWRLFRYCFPWNNGPETLHTVSLTLSAELPFTDGPRFTVSSVGDQISFVLPDTDMQHTLRVESLAPFEPNFLSQENDDLTYPTHGRIMQYTICPEPSDHVILLEDTVPTDPILSSCGEPIFSRACWAHPITDATISNAAGQHLYCACSSLHHSLANAVTWQIRVQKKAPQPMVLALIHP